MTDWNDVADGAGEKTDKELAARLDKLLTADLGKLFPNPADRDKVAGLIAKIKANTAYNERVAAFKAVAATLGGDALKTLKGAILALILALICSPACRAADMTAIDLNAPLADARIGLAWDKHGERLGVAYVPLMYWVGGQVQEYATLNLGAGDKLKNGNTSYLVSVGPRLDTLFVKMSGTKFAQRHLRFALLPPLQITACFITMDFKHFIPHLTISTRIGGR